MFLLAALTLITAGASASKKKDIVRKEKGLVAFTVDRDLPAPALEPEVLSGADVALRLVREKTSLDDGIIATSFSGDSLIWREGFNAMFDCLLSAFEDHRPVTLSPDMIWIIISQGFSHYVNSNPEKMRDMLVDFQDRRTLMTIVGDMEPGAAPDWEDIMAAFSRQIGGSVKNGLAEMMTADFSTSSPTDVTVSRITLMETVKSFFEYKILAATCGIPYVTLLGKPEDWVRLKKKTDSLEQYGLGWWTSELDPILDEFIAASKGRPDTRFWMDMVMKYRPETMNRGGGCLIPLSIDMVDGWMLKFFPFTKNGRSGERLRADTPLIPEIVMTPAQYVIVDSDTGETTVFNIELWAGIVGYALDRATGAFTPRTGWLVRMADSEDDIIELIGRFSTDNVSVTDDGITVRTPRIGGELVIHVRGEVPAELGRAGHIDEVTLDIDETSVLPEWLEKADIGRIRITGKVSREQADDIRRRFSNAVVSVPVSE